MEAKPRRRPTGAARRFDSQRVFFKATGEGFDALMHAAESGSAWTLIYPRYTVAVPHPDVLRVPLGYAVARGDVRMRDFLDAWILLKQRGRTIGSLFGYWFESKGPTRRERRWSIAGDVLGRGEPEAAEAGTPKND